MRLRPLISKNIPRPIRRRLARARFLASLARNYWYDMRRFASGSGAGRAAPHGDSLRALITMDYHRVEKGLSLHEPRPGFGAAVVQRLIRDIERYEAENGRDQTTMVAVNTLRAYCRFNREHGVDVSHVEDAIARWESRSSQESCDEGGTFEVTREGIHRVAKHDMSAFFRTRHSVRDFAPERVDRLLIEQAVQMALKTPSVCNRQSWKVFVFADPEVKRTVLQFQNGNRGFSESIDKVLIVTSSLKSFVTVGERNQCWIDGGMFAMSIQYALHSLGLGSCSLNMSIESRTDRALKKATGIPDHESVIMMIAVGHLPERFRVAQSPRRDLSGTLVWADEMVAESRTRGARPEAHAEPDPSEAAHHAGAANVAETQPARSE